MWERRTTLWEAEIEALSARVLPRVEYLRTLDNDFVMLKGKLLSMMLVWKED